jgi:hypothetical protein
MISSITVACALIYNSGSPATMTDVMRHAYDRHVSDYLQQAQKHVRLVPQYILTQSRREQELHATIFMAFIGRDHEYIAAVQMVRGVKCITIYDRFTLVPLCREGGTFFVIPTCYNQKHNEYVIVNDEYGFRAYNWVTNAFGRRIEKRSSEMLVFDNYVISNDFARINISIFNFITGEELMKFSMHNMWKRKLHFKFFTSSRFFVEVYHSTEWTPGIMMFDMKGQKIDKVVPLQGQESGNKYDLLYDGTIVLQNREVGEAENSWAMKRIELETGNVLSEYNIDNNPSRLASAVLGRDLLAVADQTTLRIIDCCKGILLQEYNINVGVISRLVYSEKTGLLACIGSRNIITYLLTDRRLASTSNLMLTCSSFYDIVVFTMDIPC